MDRRSFAPAVSLRTWMLAAGLLARALAARAQRQAAPSELRGLDQFVAGTIAEWKVPCLAVAIVRHTHVMWSRGYSYRNLEQQLPVTPRALFAISSITNPQKRVSDTRELLTRL